MSFETILVIDDNVTNAKLARVILQSEGFNVLVADSAAAARTILASRVPDLVLMDIQMPETDGLAFTVELREDARFRTLPIVGLSAYAMKGDRERGLAAGFDAYLTKPLDTDELLKTIRALLG